MTGALAPSHDCRISTQSLSCFKPAYHGHVDIAGIQLHVDLLVDGGLAVLMVVLADNAGHLGVGW